MMDDLSLDFQILMMKLVFQAVGKNPDIKESKNNCQIKSMYNGIR